MKKLISLIIVCLACSSLQAQTLRVRVDSLSVSINRSDGKIENVEKSIDGLASKVENLTYLVESQKEIISQEQSAIENSMGAVNTLLAVFSLIITIGGIFLGWFINRKEKNVQALLKQVETKKEEVEKLEESTSKTKDEIVKLNDNINNDIEGLYDRLKEAETISLFKRLVNVPLDIANVSALLLARDIDVSNFKYLLAAYRKFKIMNVYIERYEYLYILLFYQHFCGQAIAHSLVKDVLIRSFPQCFYDAYQRDIEYSTKSLVICLNEDKSIENKIDILYAYIKALSESKHKEYCPPYEIVANNYNNEDDLIQLWKKLVANKIVNKQFGELLCDRLSSNESIVSDIKKDIEEVENNDKDEPDSK